MLDYNTLTPLQKVAELESQLAQIKEHIPKAFAMFDTQMRYIMVNQRWIDSYNLADSNVIGLSHYEVFPEIGDDWKAIHQQCLAGEINKNTQAPFYRADGRLDWIEWDVRPWHHADGTIGGLLMYTDVITQAVENQQNSENQEKLFSQGNAVIFRWRAEAHWPVEYVSESIRQFGYTSQELLSGETPYASLVHPDDLARVAQEVTEHSEKKEDNFSQEYRVIAKDGSVRWTYDLTQIIRDAEGKITHYYGYILDISDLKQKESAREKADARYLSLVENNDDYVTVVDLEGRIQFVNRADPNTAPHIYGTPLINFLPPDQAVMLSEGISKVAITGETVMYNAPGQRRNGEHGFFATRMMPIYENDALSGITILSTDVTALNEAQKVITAQAERLSALVDNIPDLMFRFDADGVYVDAKEHPALLAPREALIGKKITEVIPGEMGEAYVSAFKRCLATHQIESLEYELPTPMGERAYEARIIPIFNEEVLLLVRDITERKQNEQEREALITQLKRANRIAEENSRLKSEFLSTMSHELRTPLNAIEGFTSIMLSSMGVELSERPKEMLERVGANSKRLLNLINDFLDLSRIESGRMDIVPVQVNPQKLAEMWQSEVGVLAQKKGLAFIVEVDAQLPDLVYFDEEALTKVGLNLLSNAIKFTEKGQVTLTLRQEDDYLLIQVTDTGIGIPPHAREYIFDEFRQVDSTSKRRFGGTGLGLAIVSKLTRLMGGQVNVVSEVGKGSTFIVSLPIVLNHPKGAIEA